MKSLVEIISCSSLTLGLSMMTGGQLFAAPADLPPVRGLEEIGHAQVELRGGFWGPRLKTQHEVTVPHSLNSLEKDGHVTNFDKAAGKFDGPLKGHHAFDSDLHKALEGAIYSLQHFDDRPLRRRVDGILDRILAAQQKDGFLISYFIVQQQDQRWEDLRLEHQMYNAGHFFELAAAHAQLTGDSKVLNAAKRFADHIDGIFGPGKRYDVDGHQEVELALIKLYRATGERRYLELAKFFLDERGYAHGTERKPFDPKTAVLPVKPDGPLTAEQRRDLFHAQLRVRNGRMQDHKPVVDQHEAVGHAVRAGYIYSAMTDVVRFMVAPGYERALDDLWSDVVELDLPMPVHRIYAHEKVQDDQGKVALMRGPIVYCMEAVDNPGVDLSQVVLPRDSDLRTEHRAGLLGGVTVIEGKGTDDKQTPINLTAVPYFAWQNREKGAMTVWIQQASKP